MTQLEEHLMKDLDYIDTKLAGGSPAFEDNIYIRVIFEILWHILTYIIRKERNRGGFKATT